MNWPEAGPIAARMLEAFSGKPDDVADADFARHVYDACESAARRRAVWVALDAHARTDDFCLAIADVDDPGAARFIRDPRGRKGSGLTTTKKSAAPPTSKRKGRRGST